MLTPERDNLFLQLEASHSRHLKVNYQAVRRLGCERVEKIKRRRVAARADPTGAK